MSEHEVSRVVQSAPDEVFGVVSDVGRLPEWLPTVERARTLPNGEVELSGSSYESEGFWRSQHDQLRVEWSTPSTGGEPGKYAGWLQLADSAGGGTGVTVHLSFLDEEAPDGVETELAQALESLADLVE